MLAVAATGCQAAAGAADRGTASATARPSATAATPRSAPPAASPGAHAGRPARIMIVGDSITEGSAGDYTWQYWLYKHLRADGARPKMVGPYHWLFNNVTKKEGSRAYANPRFERANDATWGMTFAHEKDVIGAKVTAWRPDYLLVLLGLDDLFWYGTSQPSMASNLAAFIASARAARPGIKIVLGLIPPDIHTQTNPKFAASVGEFNQTIIATAARMSTAASPIAVARDGTDINVAADLWDGTHPNANGEVRIAAAFADVLASRFRLGSAYPTPFPVLPTGPLTRPRLTVSPSVTGGQAKLSWKLVPGADGYRVYLRDLTKGETAFKKLPWPLSPGQDPWTAALLTPGDTYSFRIQACKGTDCGAFSNVATATV